MNISSKLRTTVTITIRTPASLASTDPSDFDRYGNPIDTDTTVSEQALILPNTLPSVSPEIEKDEDIIHASFQAFFAPTSVLTGTCKVSWTDHFNVSHEAEVVGEPQRIEDTHARPVVIMANLKESMLR